MRTKKCLTKICPVTVALAWIKSDPRRWGTFVANRVTEIQTKFPPQLWRHCPGSCNPADLPSRGAQALKVGSELWQAGPSWLRESEEKWPRTPLGEPQDCQTEERKSPPEISVCVTLTTTQGIAMDDSTGLEDPPILPTARQPSRKSAYRKVAECQHGGGWELLVWCYKLQQI